MLFRHCGAISLMIKKFLRMILSMVILILLLLITGLAFLSVKEYKSEELESLVVRSPGGEALELPEVKTGKTLTLMTWNIGYGGLGDDADSFLEGGTGVRASKEDRVNYNLTNINSQIRYQKPDLVLLQEVDTDSDRSFLIDEAQRIAVNMSEYAYTFATNHKCLYVPYPWPPQGKIDAGLMSLSRYQISQGEKHPLPDGVNWPRSIVALKPCLSVNRLPIAGIENELVVINLQLGVNGNADIKREQAKMLADFMEKESKAGNYVIAGGDFCQRFSTVDGSGYPVLEGLWAPEELNCAFFGASWQCVMDNLVPSRRALNKAYGAGDKDGFQYYLVDGFIVSSNVEIISLETKNLGFQFSHHNPVVIKVKLS